MRAPTLPTTLGTLAVVTAAGAVVLAVPGVGIGASDRPVRSPQPERVLRLGGDGRFPAEALPTVAEARRAERIGSTTLARARLSCPSGAVDFGTWCLDRDVRGTATSPVAARTCVRAGGRLPSAGRLIGAAPRVRLSSRLDDRPGSALIDPRGAADLRELSSTTFTTTTGAGAAGSTAAPLPRTLLAVTVYDNRDAGGFAGGVPVGEPERFRCAYAKTAAGPEGRPRPILRALSTASGRRLRATLAAPARGRVEARATVRSGGRTVLVGVAARDVRRAGTVRLTLRPTQEGRRRLRKGRRTAVTVRVVLRLPTGVEGTTSLRRTLRP